MGSEGLLDCYGPITQKVFLERMGIWQRFEGFSKEMSESEKEGGKSGVERVVNDMGGVYKVMVLQNMGCRVPFAFQPIDKIVTVDEAI